MNGQALNRWRKIQHTRQHAPFHKKIFSLPGISLGLSVCLALNVANRLSKIDLRPASVYMAGDVKSLWTVLLVFAAGLLVIKTPSELYWQKDCGFLARLPIPGRSHFYCALKNSAKTCFWLFLPLFFTIGIYFLFSKDATTSLKQGGFSLTIAISALTWGLAASVLAGMIVSSSQMQNAINSMGGEFQAPKSSWLGVLPGLAGVLVMAAGLGGAGWCLGEDVALGRIETLLGPLLIGGLVAAIGAYWFSDKELPLAMREVSALDREILAFVERAGPSKLETVFAKFFTTSKAGLALSHKDATLLRRRYPLPLFLFVLFIGLFGVALMVGGVFLSSWGLGFFALGVLNITYLSFCVWRDPIEKMRFLKTLPLKKEEIFRSKIAFVFLRSTIFLGLTCIAWGLVSGGFLAPAAFGFFALLLMLSVSYVFFRVSV